MGLTCLLKGHDPRSEAPAHSGLWCRRCGKAMTREDLRNIALDENGGSLQKAEADRLRAEKKAAAEVAEWKAELERKRLAHVEAERIEQEIKDRFLL